MPKQFDIERYLRVVREENAQWMKPVIAHWAESPFTVLISCILSLRTQDKTTDAASERLYALAKTPESMRKLSERTIEKAIYPVGFYRVKARQIREICRILIESHGGQVPDTMEGLLALPGVGRKTANLVLTIGFGAPGICVDTHVHRIANRWGYVKTRTPEETEMALRQKLPSAHWIALNDLLVTYGQNRCKPVSPHCSLCPLVKECPKVGVTARR
jgi:endonuclease-3